MPEAWQQWYPHIIDKWLGSNELPELSDAAYRAVHYLLMAQFQSDDGMLPGDERLLAKLSRKKAQWDEIREEVLGYFENGPDGKIYDRVMYGEWIRSRDIHSKRKAGGKSRWAKGELEDTSSTPQADLKDSSSSPIAHPTTVTGTVTKTKQEPKATPPQAVTLPDWIPIESWQGFVEMRKKIRAPLTPRAIEGTIRDLERLRASGQDPGAVLDQSTQRSWRGIFELKDGGQRPNGNTAGVSITDLRKIVGK